MSPVSVRFPSLVTIAALMAASFLSPTLVAKEVEKLRGADAILAEVRQKVASGQTVDATISFKDQLQDFRSRAASMPPEKAAEEWLKLLDAKALASRGGAARHYSFDGNEPSIISALPPPGTWQALAKAIAARSTESADKDALFRQIGLRMFAAALTSDEDELVQSLRDTQAFFKTLPEQMQYQADTVIFHIGRLLLDSTDKEDAIIECLINQLKTTKRSAQMRSSISLPDLVVLVGPEKAEALLRVALVTPNVNIDIRGEATQKLATKLAQELIDELGSPVWSLTCNLQDSSLYEAMMRRFPPGSQPMNNYELRAARGYQLLRLLMRDQTEAAFASAQEASPNDLSFDTESIQHMISEGKGELLFNLIGKVLPKSGGEDMALWETYINLSIQLGLVDQMLERLNAAITAPDTIPEVQETLKNHQIDTLLAADKTDEAIRLIREQLTTAKDKPTSASQNFALKLIDLGILLEQPPLAEEGLVHLRKEPSQQSGSTEMSDYERSRMAINLSRALYNAGHAAEAEAVLLNLFVTEVTAQQKMEKTGQRHYSGGSTAALCDLLALYYQAGRYQDVLTLLDRSPYWYASDLASFYQQSVNSYALYSRDFPIGFFVASSLIEVGRPEEARPIINALLAENNGFDPAYALLVKISSPEAAIAQLDALAKANPFEERPLIWKARVLFDQKELTTAEEIVRKAIAIDPSDGEQGPDRRMLAYALLAEILEAKGDQTDAAFFQNVMKAIRLSEKADRFAKAGLTTRAVSLYKESLTYFSDAYCIQSRIARELFEQGRQDEAEKYYRRAYELMPDSFGRVESHCFGCENAFQGKHQQTIAEQIFKEATLKTPEKPQPFYLLGYLRKEQRRYDEAVDYFRKAVELDPEYLNAWKELHQTARYVKLPKAERNKIALRLFALTPKESSTSSSILRNVSDLPAIWNAIAELPPLPQAPTALYPLKASQEALAERTPWNRAEKTELTPANAIAEQELISNITRGFYIY